MNPDPNAYRPSSLDLEDAARMKSESELESTQAHTMRNNRDLEAVMAIRTHGRSSDEHYPRYRNGDMWNQ